MCMWCAYAGKRPAAPLLWNALRGIEGLWGGFYTGLVTLDQGKFHWGKCAGSTELWPKKFALCEFPGTSGLIHSRTDSGGDSNFAHPFVGCHGLVAAVSQGCTGKFSAQIENYAAAGNFLLAQGRFFRGATWNLRNTYKYTLADGTRVPMAEITANLVEYFYEQSHDPIQAMRLAAEKMPEEAATIFLFADRPGEIGFTNSNQHVVWSQLPDGVMLSVTALGVPGEAQELPGNSVGLVSLQGVKIERIGDFYPLDLNIPELETTCAVTVNYLQTHPGVLLGHIVDQAIAPLFLESEALQFKAVAGYRAIEKLYREHRISWKPERCSGGSGEPGRIFKIYLQN